MVEEIKKEGGKAYYPVKRCPKCHVLSLEFDTETKQIMCKRCGFVQKIPFFERLVNLFKK